MFDVPIATSVSPAGSEFAELADTRRPVSEHYSALLGKDHQLPPLGRTPRRETWLELRRERDDTGESMRGSVGVRSWRPSMTNGDAEQADPVEGRPGNSTSTPTCNPEGQRGGSGDRGPYPPSQVDLSRRV